MLWLHARPGLAQITMASLELCKSSNAVEHLGPRALEPMTEKRVVLLMLGEQMDLKSPSECLHVNHAGR